MKIAKVWKGLVPVTALILSALPCPARGNDLAEQYKQSLKPPAQSGESPRSVGEPGAETAEGRSKGLKMVSTDPAGNTRVTPSPSLTIQLEFRLNSTELTPSSVKYLDALGTALQDSELRGYVYKVEGHTCNMGNPEYNLKLSEGRARAVVDYMVDTFGLHRDQFAAIGFGEGEPVAPNNTEDGRSKNRRVVIVNTLDPYIPPAIGKPRINVRMISSRASREREVGNGDTLTERDGYAVELRPETSAYVYIYQVDRDGKPTLLFPNKDFSVSANGVEPGRLYRIPDMGKWFYLDANKGEERIVVLARKDAFENPEEVCMHWLNGNATGTAAHYATAPPSTGFGGSPNEGRGKGLMGTREEFDVQPPPPPSSVDMSGVMVWERVFLHQ